jgi:hypothetical protein
VKQTVQQIVHQARERARTILVQEWPRVRALAITAEDEILLERMANAFQLLLLADEIECRCHQADPGVFGLFSLTPGAGSTSPAQGGEGDD